MVIHELFCTHIQDTTYLLSVKLSNIAKLLQASIIPPNFRRFFVWSAGFVIWKILAIVTHVGELFLWCFVGRPLMVG